MKKSMIFLLTVLLTLTGVVNGQSSKRSVEVLYFKANLACCKARACNALEAEIKAIIEENFTNGNVSFRVVKIADETNKALVEQYNAQSQSVILLCKRKKKAESVDVSQLVSNYTKDRNKEIFVKELIAKINEHL